MTPYGDIDLGQHWLRWWLDAWRYQTITWTNVDLSSVRSCIIHLRTLSKEALKVPISKASLKIEFLKLHPNLPGANELKTVQYVLNHQCPCGPVTPYGIIKLYSSQRSIFHLEIIMARWCHTVMDFCQHTWSNVDNIILMAWCKNDVNLVCQQWNYLSFALTHWCRL